MVQINERFYSSGAVFLIVILMMGIAGGGVYFWFNVGLQKQAKEVLATNKILQNKVVELQSRLDAEAANRVQTVFQNASAAKDTFILDYKFENNGAVLNGRPIFISLKDGKIISFSDKTKRRLALGKENITAIYAPLKPDSPDSVFISTAKSNTSTSSLNRVYLYNLKTGNLAEIYKETSDRLLRSAALYGKKLILLVENKKQDSAACFSPWSEWNQFVSLNIANTYAKPEPFQLPADKIEEGRAELSSCLEEKGN